MKKVEFSGPMEATSEWKADVFGHPGLEMPSDFQSHILQCHRGSGLWSNGESQGAILTKICCLSYLIIWLEGPGLGVKDFVFSSVSFPHPSFFK